VRREVVARDGLQCSFTTPDGQRCQARAFLEFDHELALARGGPDTVENLRLFCTRHNLLHAEQDFGAEMIQEAIKRRRSA
jgi:5-methylcytosine-specific restriction endonuclease McrA